MPSTESSQAGSSESRLPRTGPIYFPKGYSFQMSRLIGKVAKAERCLGQRRRTHARDHVYDRNTTFQATAGPTFPENEQLYVKGNIHRIHVKPLTHREEFVVDYAGKAIKRKRFSNDDILILPKSLSEVSNAQLSVREMSPVERGIMAIQSRYNVSDEIALAMYQTYSSRRGRPRGD